MTNAARAIVNRNVPAMVQRHERQRTRELTVAAQARSRSHRAGDVRPSHRQFTGELDRPLQDLTPINDQLADIIIRAKELWIETETGKAWMKVQRMQNAAKAGKAPSLQISASAAGS